MLRSLIKLANHFDSKGLRVQQRLSLQIKKSYRD